MRIQQIRLLPYDLPLAAPWRWAGGVWHRRQGWLVEIHTTNGLTGLGDCPPLPQMGGESVAAAGQVLRHSLAEWPGRNVQATLEGLEYPACPAARYALETALLDLLAQQQNRPLHRFLNPHSGGRVRVNASLGSLDAGILNRAAAAMDQGFTIGKVKVGLGGWADESPRLFDLLSACAGRMRLRLDANRAWEPVEALQAVRSLRGLEVEGLEDPLRDPSPSWLRRVQDQADFPLAADETLGILGAEQLLSSRSVRRLVLKPALLGGLLPCLALARQAACLAVECVVTSALDSAIGLTASSHLAAALNTDMAHGLDTARWILDDLALAPVPEHGCITLTK